jgi:hypothetical protein
MVKVSAVNRKGGTAPVAEVARASIAQSKMAVHPISVADERDIGFLIGIA